MHGGALQAAAVCVELCFRAALLRGLRVRVGKSCRVEKAPGKERRGWGETTGLREDIYTDEESCRQEVHLPHHIHPVPEVADRQVSDTSRSDLPNVTSDRR